MATLKKTVRQSAHFWCFLQFLIWLCGPKLSQYWLLLVLSRGRLKMNGDVSGFWGCLKHPGIFWVVNASYPEEMGLGRIQGPRALSSPPALSKRELPICSSPQPTLGSPTLPSTPAGGCIWEQRLWWGQSQSPIMLHSNSHYYQDCYYTYLLHLLTTFPQWFLSSLPYIQSHICFWIFSPCKPENKPDSKS